MGADVCRAATNKISVDCVTTNSIMLMFDFSNMGMFGWISMSERILLVHGDVAKAILGNISSAVGRAIAAVVAFYVRVISGLLQFFSYF